MRQKRTTQTSLLEPNAVDHPFAEDVERMSAFLDEHPEFAGSSSGNFSPCLANRQTPSCVLSSHDMILASSSLLCSWRVPSPLFSFRVRLT